MAASPALFEVQIPEGKGTHGTGPGGRVSIVCTQPQPQVYLLTFEHGPDNRLVTAFCEALHLALDIIQHRCAPGVVLTTSALAKFYSNGMDLDHAAFAGAFLPEKLYALWRRLLTYPMARFHPDRRHSKHNPPVCSLHASTTHTSPARARPPATSERERDSGSRLGRAADGLHQHQGGIRHREASYI